MSAYVCRYIWELSGNSGGKFLYLFETSIDYLRKLATVFAKGTLDFRKEVILSCQNFMIALGSEFGSKPS